MASDKDDATSLTGSTSLKILTFDGDEDKWVQWSAKFQTLLVLKNLKPYLVLDPNKHFEVLTTAQFEESLADLTRKELMDAEKMHWDGNSDAYLYLSLATTDNPFDVVNDFETDKLPGRDSRLAWSWLVELYKLNKPRDLANLQKTFTNCLLYQKWEDPNKWFLNLDIII